MKAVAIALVLIASSDRPSSALSFVLRPNSSPSRICTNRIICGPSHYQKTNYASYLQNNYNNNNNNNASNEYKNNAHDDLLTNQIKTRRNVLQHVASIATITSTMGVWTNNASAAPPSLESPPTTTTTTTTPKITHKVNINVRISRADGTFYVRDDPPGTIPTPDNQVFTGTLTLGLYGSNAPNHVSRFLQYAVDSTMVDPFEDIPKPSYSRSLFTTFSQSNGLLTAGTIPGLHLTTFNGASALEYRGRITPASLWLEKKSTNNAGLQGQEEKPIVLTHSRGGLLTHRNLDVLPDYGITTREARELDSTHTIFGEVLPTESSKAFFNRIVDLPTYSNSRPMSVGTNISSTNSTTSSTLKNDNLTSNSAVEEVASSFYSFQKDLFRSAAKTFGDTRIDNIYEGKILRRVEVTSVSIETM